MRPSAGSGNSPDGPGRIEGRYAPPQFSHPCTLGAYAQSAGSGELSMFTDVNVEYMSVNRRAAWATEMPVFTDVNHVYTVF